MAPLAARFLCGFSRNSNGPSYPAQVCAATRLHTHRLGTAENEQAFFGHAQKQAPAQGSGSKGLLGKTGAIRRVAAFAIVYRGYVGKDDWVGETLDSHSDGGFYVTVFSGPSAKEPALEYAGEKYSGVQLHAPDQSPHK